ETDRVKEIEWNPQVPAPWSQNTFSPGRKFWGQMQSPRESRRDGSLSHDDDRAKKKGSEVAARGTQSNTTSRTQNARAGSAASTIHSIRCRTASPCRN